MNHPQAPRDRDASSAPVGQRASAGTTARRLAAIMAGLACIGLGIAAYLTVLKAAGEAPVCVVGGGCESVQTSAYSVVLGIPVAAYGVAWSGAALAAAIVWWRSGDRRALLLLYAGGLGATLVEAYLVYLELFVIHAVCSWCVAYGLTVVAGWLCTIPALRIHDT